MRIIAGENKGIRLKAPSSNATRPTTDRVREALFSSLFSHDVDLEQATVLDAFGGTGALGLEALSRGAKQVVFCENSKEALQLLRQNIQSCSAGSKAKVLSCDALSLPASVKTAGPYSLVFLDPPYAIEPAVVFDFIDSLRNCSALTSDCLISYEMKADNAKAAEDLAQSYNLQVSSNKRYGTSVILFLRLQLQPSVIADN